MGAIDIINSFLAQVSRMSQTGAIAARIPTMSDGSLEKKIVDVVGTYADTEAIERRNTLDVISSALASQKVTTVEYYRRKAVEFQQGGTLSYDPISQGAYYETIDESKRIVKQAFVVGSFPEYTMLVNKLGADNHLTTLTSEELASFRTYFAAFQPLGLQLAIGSLDVARITDPQLTIYVKAGSDATVVANAINERFIANEAVLRATNTVSVSELSDIIQKDASVVAVYFANLSATERQIDGTMRTVQPENGLFHLTSGAFTFATTVTSDMIKVLE